MHDLDPNDSADIERELEVSLLRDSFADFVRGAWHLIEPARPYTPNIASDAVVEHLQAIADGRLRRLIVSISPGLGKSSLASVAYPAWRLARDPRYRVICASHAHSLAVTASLKCRRIVESPWFQARFPARLRADENRSDYWATTHDGRRLAVGVGGALVGFRASEAIVDDSLSGADARSKATREATNTWFDESLSTRLDDPDRASMCVIQQRLHSSDLVGHLLELGGWEALVLPAEYEPTRKCTTSVWTDPRTEPGELLAPELHSAAFLAEQRHTLGTAGFSSMYLQNPTDSEGGLFQREFWRWHKPDGVATGVRRPRGCNELPAVPLPSKFDRTIVSLDAAFKDLASSDAVCFLVLGVLGAERYVIDRRYGRMSFTNTVKTLLELVQLYPRATVLVEDKANGSAIIDVLKRSVPGIIPITPKESKESRAAACSPLVEAGNVLLPEGATWIGELVEEAAQFPKGANDDMVDALTQALNYIATGMSNVERARKLLGVGRALFGVANPGSQPAQSKPALTVEQEIAKAKAHDALEGMLRRGR